MANLPLDATGPQEDGPDAEAALRQYLGLCKAMKTSKVAPFCLHSAPDTCSVLLQTPSKGYRTLSCLIFFCETRYMILCIFK